MTHSDFEAGIWAKSWDELNQSSCIVGTANLEDSGIILDIPCGHLLDEPNVVVNGKRPVSSSEYLYGYTRNNYYLVLHNAEHILGSRTIPGLPSERIRAKELFAAKGHQFDVKRPVIKMAVYCSGLTQWYHKTAFEVRLNSDNYLFDNLRYEEEFDQPVTLYKDSDLTIDIGSNYVFPSLQVEEMTFRHQNFVMVSFVSGRKVSEAVSFAGDLSRFLSLCMGVHAYISEIDFFFEGSDFKVEYFNDVRKPSVSKKYDVQRMPFPYSTIADQLPALIGNWMNVNRCMGDDDTFAYLKHAAELVVSVLMYDWDMPIQPLYVSASQALESLARYRAKRDGRLHSLSIEDYSSYTAQLKSLVEECCEEFRFWVMGHFNGNEKGMRRLIRELFEDQADLFNWLIPDTKTFLRMQLDLRNRFTHPSPCGEGDLEVVWNMTQAVSLAAAAIIWSYLGLNCEFIQTGLNQSRYKESVFRWLRSRFALN